MFYSDIKGSEVFDWDNGHVIFFKCGRKTPAHYYATMSTEYIDHQITNRLEFYKTKKILFRKEKIKHPDYNFIEISNILPIEK